MQLFPFFIQFLQLRYAYRIRNNGLNAIKQKKPKPCQSHDSHGLYNPLQFQDVSVLHLEELKNFMKIFAFLFCRMKNSPYLSPVKLIF
jgi:hypothetical protein